jgi:hypothetical protein
VPRGAAGEPRLGASPPPSSTTDEEQVHDHYGRRHPQRVDTATLFATLDAVKGDTDPAKFQFPAAETSKARVEHATLVVSGDPTAPPSAVKGEAAPDPPTRWQRLRRQGRLRRLADPLLLVVLAGSVFAATEMTGGRDPLYGERPDAGQPAGLGTPYQSPRSTGSRLVVPSTARPGERITVVGYRDSALCGPSELRFDGTVVDHRITATAAPYTPWLTELFIVMTVPAAATPGAHRIELFGPVASGRSGPICGDTPERHGRLAAEKISIGP